MAVGEWLWGRSGPGGLSYDTSRRTLVSERRLPPQLGCKTGSSPQRTSGALVGDDGLRLVIFGVAQARPPLNWIGSYSRAVEAGPEAS